VYTPQTGSGGTIWSQGVLVLEILNKLSVAHSITSQDVTHGQLSLSGGLISLPTISAVVDVSLQGIDPSFELDLWPSSVVEWQPLRLYRHLRLLSLHRRLAHLTFILKMLKRWSKRSSCCANQATGYLPEAAMHHIVWLSSKLIFRIKWVILIFMYFVYTIMKSFCTYFCMYISVAAATVTGTVSSVRPYHNRIFCRPAISNLHVNS